MLYRDFVPPGLIPNINLYTMFSRSPALWNYRDFVPQGLIPNINLYNIHPLPRSPVLPLFATTVISSLRDLLPNINLYNIPPLPALQFSRSSSSLLFFQATSAYQAYSSSCSSSDLCCSSSSSSSAFLQTVSLACLLPGRLCRYLLRYAAACCH